MIRLKGMAGSGGVNVYLMSTRWRINAGAVFPALSSGSGSGAGNVVPDGKLLHAAVSVVVPPLLIPTEGEHTWTEALPVGL